MLLSRPSLPVTLAGAVALAAFSPIGSAAADPGDSFADLAVALTSCTGTGTAPYEVALTASVSDPAGELVVACHVVLDLAGHDLTVRNVVVASGQALGVTDTTPAGGTLTADASAVESLAGIGITGAELTTHGTSRVVARGGTSGSAVGGRSQQPGGSVETHDSSSLTAIAGSHSSGIGGGYLGGPGTFLADGQSTVQAQGGMFGTGIGGTQYQPGGNVTVAGQAQVTAVGSDYAAGVGGGFAADGGTVLVTDEATLVAVGGSQAAGVGGGIYGDGGQVTVAGGTLVASGPAAVGGGVVPSYDTTSPPSAFGSLELTDGGRLVVDGSLPVPDSATGPEISLDAASVISGNGVLSGDGQVANGGAIRLPVGHVSTPVTGHHYWIALEVAGGALPNGSADHVTVHAASLTSGDRGLPTVTRQGHAFLGWTLPGEGGPVSLTGVSVLPGSSESGDPVPLVATAGWEQLAVDLPLPVLTNTSSQARGVGAPAVGDDLSAAASPLDPDDATLTYRWSRTDVEGSAPIAGAEDASYTITPGDLGSTVTVEVTATRAPWSATVRESNTTGAVVPATLPALTATVSGRPIAGNTLTVQPELAGPEPDGYVVSHAWTVDDVLDVDATSGSFTLTPDLIGSVVAVTVTASAPGHADRVVTPDPVTVLAPHLLALEIDGAAQVGAPLTASVTPSPDEGASVTWQWQLLDAEGGVEDIGGATGPAFTPTPGMLGRTLRVRATSVSPGAPTTAETVTTSPVVEGDLGEAVATVTGRPVENQRLVGRLAIDRTSDVDSTTTWRWKAAGVTRERRLRRRTFLLGPAQVGEQLVLVATVSAPGYATEVLRTSPTPAIRRATYLASRARAVDPGSSVRVYGRGPARATTFRMVTPSGPLTGRLGAEGLVRRTVTMPGDACGPTPVRVVWRDRRGDALSRSSVVLDVRGECAP